jgi:integrase
LKAWRILRAIVNQAGIETRCARGLADGVRFSPRAGKPVKERASLTVEEIRRLLQAADTQPLDVRAMTYVLATSGMRFGELAALEWSDLDLAEGVVTVSKSAVVGQVNAPKTGLIRRIPLLPWVVAVLQEHQAAQTGGSLVFPSKAGTYRAPAMFFKVLGRLCKLARIDKTFGAHSLRRSFVNATRTVADQAVVRSMSGHATEAMHEHYSRIGMDERRTAAEEAFKDVIG